MKDPFQDPENAARMQKALDAIQTCREEIDNLREWTTGLLDAEENEPKEGCSCVRDELFDMDTLLFSIHRMLHLVGSGLVTHLNAIDHHERGRELRDKALEAVEAGAAQTWKVGDGVSLTVVPLPVNLEDQEPDPGDIH